MAISILIKFPISTVQYEQKYMLGIEFDYSATLEARLRDDSAFVESGSTEACLMFIGTLNGDTVIQTDHRESIYEPLITSKLKFNIVSHNFPSWLIEETRYYTDVRVVLALLGEKGGWLEQWRGYLWGNTLNSVVVDDYISTPVFALDEISMGKYLKLHNTIGPYGKSRRLWNYFAYYKSFNDSYFGHIYQFMQIAYADDEIYWDSKYCLHSADDELADFLDVLYFDSYGYVFQDKDEEKLAWKDLFSDVCQYLGVTFMVGNHGNQSNDAYLLETADQTTAQDNYLRFIHNNETHNDVYITSAGTWTTIIPNEKCDAQFNITLEPAKYKGVKVKSEIKRYESHDFLDDDNLEYWDENSYVLHRWGIEGSGLGSVASYCVDSPKYHKLYYMKPSHKEEQYIETKMTNIDATNNFNANLLINVGYLQADMTAQNYDYPYNKTNLGYLLSKMGGAIIKTGEFDMREATEDEDLDNYIVLMNHKWINGGWLDDYIAAMDGSAQYALTGNQYEAVKLKPFGHHEIRHNNETHWLKFDYNLVCGNENLGELDRLTSTSPYHVADMRGSEALAMPTNSTEYEYEDEDNAYGSEVGSYYNGTPIDGYPPIIRWEATHGNYELTERGHWVTTGTTGLTRGYNVSHFPASYDKCVYAISASTDSFGYKFCPYYNDLKPKSGGGKKDLLLDIYSYGGPNYPIDGELELTIKNPSICFDWKNGRIGYLNNIFFLLSSLKFSFTDEAEIMDKPTEYEEMDVYDTLSKTKEIDEISFNLSTPQYDGLFYNCFQYTGEGGKAILNAKKFYEQNNNLYGESMEFWTVKRVAEHVAPAPMQIELNMRFDAIRDYSILNNSHIIIDDLTETPYKFQMRDKAIYINRDIVKFKADRVYDDPWRDMDAKPNKASHETLPVDNNDYEQ